MAAVAAVREKVVIEAVLAAVLLYVGAAIADASYAVITGADRREVDAGIANDP